MRHRKDMVIFMEGVDVGREREENGHNMDLGGRTGRTLTVRDRSEVKDNSVPAGHLTEYSLWKGSKFSCLSSPCSQAVCSRSKPAHGDTWPQDEKWNTKATLSRYVWKE